VTRAYLKVLSNWEEALKQQWANGELNGESMEATAMANAQAVGMVHQLKKLRGMDYDQFYEALSETKDE